MQVQLDNKYEVLTSDGKVETQKLEDILGVTKTILYFYPKDNTPGCSIENKDFSQMKDDFQRLGYKLVGVSKDPISSHEKFQQNHDLHVDLISDPELVLHKELGVYGEKNNYGKKVMGVIRSTFILDEENKIVKEFRNIRAKGHAERIYKEVKKLA